MKKYLLLVIVALMTSFFTVKPVKAQSNYCVHVPVLFYHHIEPSSEAKQNHQTSLDVDPKFFDSQMAYLSQRGYSSMSVAQLIDALLNHKSLPAKPVVITLDDGYNDAYTNAYPIARKYGLILNLMIPTGLMENSGYLSWNDLKQMVDSGRVFAYNHTWSHYSLNRGDENKIRYEVTQAQTQLKDHLGFAENIITYPYGAVNQKVMKVLQELGYKAGFTTNKGRDECFSNVLSLPRIRIGNAALSRYKL